MYERESWSGLVPADGFSVHVREWGPVASTHVLFFWHGAEFHSGRNVAEIAGRLARSGVRTIALDAPGFGRSPSVFEEHPEQADPRRLAELASTIVAARSDAPAVFAGHSWAGNIGCWAVADPAGPWAGLVLLDGGYFDFGELIAQVLRRTPEQALADLHDRFDTLSYAGWSAYFEALAAGMLRWEPAQPAMYAEAARAESDGTIHPIVSGPDARAIAQALVQRPTSGSWAALAATDRAVRLLRSTEPAERVAAREVGFAAQFARAVPQALVQSVPNATHEILDDAPEPVARAIAEVLGVPLDAVAPAG
jgi:pimeloyl-ACP methyl ester carboxylesterase